MANTYTLIGSTVVSGSSAASMSFSSIPNTYTDLVLRVSSRINDANNWMDFALSFNGVTTATYPDIIIYGSGSAAGGTTDNGPGVITRTSTTANTASTFGNSEIYIPNYLSSNYKCVNSDAVSENNETAAITCFTAGLWKNTSAITSITLTPINSATFTQYSTAYLYGIKNS